MLKADKSWSTNCKVKHSSNPDGLLIVTHHESVKLNLTINPVGVWTKNVKSSLIRWTKIW